MATDATPTLYLYRLNEADLSYVTHSVTVLPKATGATSVAVALGTNLFPRVLIAADCTYFLYLNPTISTIMEVRVWREGIVSS